MKGKICAICALGVSLSLVERVQAQEAVIQQMAEELYKAYEQINAADTAYKIIKKTGLIDEARHQTLASLGKLGKDQSYIDSMKYIEEAFKEQLYKPTRTYTDYYEREKDTQHYKPLKDFDQSNWNWLLLQEYVATNRHYFGSSIATVLTKACETLNTATGMLYTNNIECAKQDLMWYLRFGYGAIIQKVFGQYIIGDDISKKRKRCDTQQTDQEFQSQCDNVQDKFNSEYPKHRTEKYQETECSEASGATEVAKLIAKKYREILERNKTILYDKPKYDIASSYDKIHIQNSLRYQLSQERQQLIASLANEIQERTSPEGTVINTLLDDIKNPQKYKDRGISDRAIKIKIIEWEIGKFITDLSNKYINPKVKEQESFNAIEYKRYTEEMSKAKKVLKDNGNNNLIGTLDNEIHNATYSEDKELMNSLKEVKILYQTIVKKYTVNKHDIYPNLVMNTAKNKLIDEYSQYLTASEIDDILNSTKNEIDRIYKQETEQYKVNLPILKQALNGNSIMYKGKMISPVLTINGVSNILKLTPDIETTVRDKYEGIVVNEATKLVNNKYSAVVQNTYNRLKNGILDKITLKKTLGLVLSEREQEEYTLDEQLSLEEKKARDRQVSEIKQAINEEEIKYNQQIIAFQELTMLYNDRHRINRIYNLVMNMSLNNTEPQEAYKYAVGLMNTVKYRDDSMLWMYDQQEINMCYQIWNFQYKYRSDKFLEWRDALKQAVKKLAFRQDGIYINPENMSLYDVTLIHSIASNIIRSDWK